MPVGNRIFLRRETPDPALIEAFRQIPAANVADSMNRLCAMNYHIRLMSAPKQAMCGAAITVRAAAGDNFFFHRALDLAGEGDVIVVSTAFGGPNSLIGEIIASNAAHKKLAGMVFDTPIRDIDAISKMELPIYATGTTPGGPYRNGPGEINVPIACGNVVVEPGDIILGDADGVIVIPRRDAPAILPAAQKYALNDHKTLEASSAGTWDRSWVTEKIAANQVEVIDGCYR